MYLIGVFGIITVAYPFVAFVYMTLFSHNFNLRFTNGFDIGQYVSETIRIYIPVVVALTAAAILPFKYFDARRGLSLTVVKAYSNAINYTLIVTLLLYATIVFKYSSLVLYGYLHATNSHEAQDIVRIFGEFDTAIFLLLIVRIAYASDRSRKFGWLDAVVGILFILLKFALKMRYGIVIFALIWMFGYFVVWRHPFRKKQALLLSICAIAIMIGVNYVRASISNSNIGLGTAFFNFGLEFYFSSLSLMNGINLMHNGQWINTFGFFFDPFVYAIPTVFFSSHVDKLNDITYLRYVSHVGKSLFDPLGGVVLPIQLYLATASYFAVFVFYFLLGITLRLYVAFLSWKHPFFISIGLFGVSLYMIAAFRTPYYILQSYLLRDGILFNVIILFIMASLVKSRVLRHKS